MILISASVYAADRFDQIKRDWSAASMIQFEIFITVESEIFNSVDSATGEIFIADDGRYCAKIGEELHLFDSKCIWEVSFANRQATRQCLNDGEKFENRLIFLKDLGSYYKSSVLEKDRKYLLIKNDGVSDALPDSLTIYLSESSPKISHVEFYDLNSELNHVYLNDAQIFSEVKESVFKFVPPDSLEVINLP